MAITKVLAPRNNYCGNCTYLDSNMYEHINTTSKVYGCMMFGIRLFTKNEKPVRCSECVEKGVKQ